ncbi:HAMP domain-containing sensor histidine kinase [Vibrio sp. THAF190c]|uniref:sensor histidine kinase n=1 Tax=Vibrio sp. THAF190c TaxID=2587865 RepID=UPI001268D2F4|nr:ATP-binding protein [Vibrio sp. THAF190c]QFT11488.1 Sensor protein RstB [Vibrio sp. THAF190c]
MLKVFSPIYILVLSVWLVGESVREGITEHFFLESYSEDVLNDYQGAFAMVTLILEQYPQSDWQSLSEQMSSPNIPIQVLKPDLSIFPTNLLSDWKENKIVVLDARNDLLIKKIEGTNLGVQIGPIGTIEEKDNDELFVSITVTGLLALLILLWTLGIQRRLNQILQAAKRLGEGDLSTRVLDTNLNRIGSLNFHFNSMASRIEQLVNTNRRLSMAVSHELRAPLSRIQFELEYALEESDAENMRSALKSIEEDCIELESLVNESLFYAKYNQREHDLQLKSKNLVQWMFIWLESFKPIRKDIVIDYKLVDEDVYVELNDAALSRALGNILHNACRYARKNVKVYLTAHSESILILIQDDGKGIENGELHDIFSPFYRSNNQPSESKGFGLGLSISTQIIEKHQGSIVASNLPGGGAEFAVQLPRQTNSRDART